MFQFLHDLIFESTPARFESRHSMTRSVQRLAVKLDSPSSVDDHAEGEVSALGVRIWRSNPSFRNAFRPVFTGNFGMENGKVFLEGHFALSKVMKWVLILTFAILFCMAGVVLASLLWGTAEVDGVYVMLFFTAVIVLVAWLGRVLGRGDMHWISDIIRRAFEN